MGALRFAVHVAVSSTRVGINTHGARFMCHARALGVDYGRTATIGRQRLSLKPASLAPLLNQYDYRPGQADVDYMLAGSGGYAEGLLRYLGAARVDSFDLSEYEGATHLHDFNDDLPPQFDRAYSAVFDSGSLEHIFDVRTAIRNCMRMVSVGGHYLCILPANNFFGHGFYQFSPEFFYQVFSPPNGFEITAMMAFEDEPDAAWESADPDAPWYAVESPLKLRERVTLVNSKPVSLMIVAKRIQDKPLFAASPQQSDYVARWDGAAGEPPRGAPAPSGSALRRIAKRVLPSWVRARLRTIAEPRPKPLGAGFERRFFRKVPRP